MPHPPPPLARPQGLRSLARLRLPCQDKLRPSPMFCSLPFLSPVAATAKWRVSSSSGRAWFHVHFLLLPFLLLPVHLAVSNVSVPVSPVLPRVPAPSLFPLLVLIFLGGFGFYFILLFSVFLFFLFVFVFYRFQRNYVESNKPSRTFQAS